MLKKLWKQITKRKKEDLFYKKSFSQDGEDMVLSSFYDDMGGKENGFFIDVGAHHPFRFSNTAYFYEKGWNGINIEPTPNSIILFEQYRKRDINLNIGIGNGNHELTFYCFHEPALNSFDKELSQDRHNNTNFKIKEEVKIPIYPLSEILDKYLPKGQKIDFMSIDAEGLDFEVLKSNNWDKYKPEFILAEDILDESLLKSEIYLFLKEKGYVMQARTKRTLIFQLYS